MGQYIFEIDLQVFLLNLECSTCIPENARTDSLNFCFFNFCNNCLFVEVSNNEILDFLTSSSCI